MQPVSLPLASPICLDLVNECLRYGAQTISLRPKTFAVLQCLIDHAQQLVSKTTLLEVVWPETVVGDGRLSGNQRQQTRPASGSPRRETSLLPPGLRYLPMESYTASKPSDRTPQRRGRGGRHR